MIINKCKSDVASIKQLRLNNKTVYCTHREISKNQPHKFMIKVLGHLPIFTI